MKMTFKSSAENLLFPLNIFIVFLLVFAYKISIPYWLQPIGRLHPMLLHFPVVLLLLAMLLECFRFRSVYKNEKLYQNFSTGLLLTGIFLSAVTAIMGLLLSGEEGYSGDTLVWHKWTGLSLVFVSTVVYWIRSFSWYNAAMARLSALITISCLILAGHYGAALTHGDNFVTSPLTDHIGLILNMF